MADLPVIILGAGLAGLSCAVRLQREGIEVAVLEASDDVGGRVRTDVVGGFTIDRGFQVLNTAYPALKRAVDLDSLNLRALPRGIRVRRGGRLYDVPHPLASAAAPLRALTSGVVDPRGKLGLARYAAGLLASSPRAIKERSDVPARVAWSEVLAPGVVSGLVAPFMSGVVLEDEIATSRIFTDLMMRMFATGASAVPAAGMQALPAALAAQLPDRAIRLESAVTSLSSTSVTLADGSELPARAVVVATDPWTAHELLPELGPPPAARGVTTYYFAATRWDRIDGTLVVDADTAGIASSVVITATAPEYSRDGRALIATSALTGPEAPGSVGEVRGAAAELHRSPNDDWELIATRFVPRALPAMPAPHPLRKPAYAAGAGVWVAGDHRDTSSLQGALVSGTRIASSVARHLVGGAPASGAGAHTFEERSNG